MITVVSSFLEFVPSILKVPGVTVFLSVKLNQDPLEKFFGCIRQHGRVNDNPTVLQAMTATQTLRVANSLRFATITGNCRGASKKERVDGKRNPRNIENYNSPCISAIVFIELTD